MSEQNDDQSEHDLKLAKAGDRDAGGLTGCVGWVAPQHDARAM